MFTRSARHKFRFRDFGDAIVKAASAPAGP